MKFCMLSLRNMNFTIPIFIINSKNKRTMQKYVCDVCGYVYDPAAGDPDSGIEPGTAFEDIPEDWVCPICGVTKEDFHAE